MDAAARFARKYKTWSSSASNSADVLIPAALSLAELAIAISFGVMRWCFIRHGMHQSLARPGVSKLHEALDRCADFIGKVKLTESQSL